MSALFALKLHREGGGGALGVGEGGGEELYNEKKVEAAQCLAELPDSRSRTSPAPPPPAPTSGSPTGEKGPRNEPYLGQSQLGPVPVCMNVCRPSTFEAEDAAASQMGGSEEGKPS